jgi:hypothetical protein
MFFLDTNKRGRMSIQSILLSPILTEIFELRDPQLLKEIEKHNWFSTLSSLRIYNQFLALDTDHNGMLSTSELYLYNGGTMVSFFVDRVFQEYQTYGGEMVIQFVFFVEKILYF